MQPTQVESDARGSRQHVVPGVLERHDPLDDAVPVVFDSPHSGCEYPADFGHAMPFPELRRAEDAFVDELYVAAPRHGAVLLKALFPRSYIDPNRAPDDIDETLLTGPWPEGANPSVKVRYGIGLIAKRQPGGPLYDRKLGVGEVRSRLERYYWPYHQTLKAILDHHHSSSDVVWHINCHSMKSLSASKSPNSSRTPRPDFCLGDQDGRTCESGLRDLVADALSSYGYHVAINKPYKGVELVSRYSDPQAGRSSLQIEVNRRLYMDQTRVEKHGGFELLQRRLSDLVLAVCDYARGRLR